MVRASWPSQRVPGMQPGLRVTSLRGEAEFSRAGPEMEGPCSGKNEKVSAECQKHMVCPCLWIPVSLRAVLSISDRTGSWAHAKHSSNKS